MPLIVIPVLLCLSSVWPASGHETRNEGRKIVYKSNALDNTNTVHPQLNELLHKTRSATNHSVATSERVHATKSTHFANVEPKVVHPMLEYPVRSAPSATVVPSSVGDVRPASSDAASPVYTADQYVDYYWQPPTPSSLDIQHNSVDHKQTPDEVVFVLDSPVAVANENNVVRIPTGLLVGLSTVQRTVFIVIDRIRSMWDFVWSYFRVPGPSIFMQAARALQSLEAVTATDGRVRHGSHGSLGLHVPKRRVRKRYRKFLMPLLLAYKLKFFTMIPMLIGGLVLLTGSAGMSGFFFALFTAVLSMKHKPI